MDENQLLMKLKYKENECKKLRQELEPTTEMCPYCNREVELYPYLGIQECPNCKKLIISCSMCETKNCTNCNFKIIEKLEAKNKEIEKLNNIIACINKNHCASFSNWL